MSLVNSLRSGCKDVFNAYLVRLAVYAGVFEFPVIQATHTIPNRIIPFSRALKTDDFDQWVHFYEDDYLFEKLWDNPKDYLEFLKKFNGVILPDFSLYRDMPFVMQLWNIYRSRAIGHWLQVNGVTVIPNIRYGDKRTYKCCCDGIQTHCVIAVGSHGTIKNKLDRKIFVDGLEIVIKRLQPSVIVVYGAAPDDIFDKYRQQGIQIVVFDSEISKAMRKGVV